MKEKKSLREWREDRDWTQTELGKRAGFSFQHVSAVERGDAEATDDFLKKSAAALGIQKDQIVIVAPLSAERLNELEPEWSNPGDKPHPVEIQQFQTALEFVLGKLTQEQTDGLHAELRKMKSLPTNKKLTLGVRQLISATLMKVEDKREEDAPPNN